MSDASPIRHRSTVIYWNKALRYGMLAAPAGYPHEVYLAHMQIPFRHGVGCNCKTGEVLEYEILSGKDKHLAVKVSFPIETT